MKAILTAVVLAAALAPAAAADPARTLPPPVVRGQELPPPLEQRVLGLENALAGLEWRQSVDASNFDRRLYELERRLGTGVTAPLAAAAVPTARAVAVPPGHHAHRTTDGRVIVHSDTNHGNAAAHAGVQWPWPKVAYAGQVVASSTTVTAATSAPLAVASCPAGGCQTAARAGPVRRLLGFR